jgi:TetR/AcrR family transcriptional regulator, regulator of autoinduction and epiphytic fitness
MADIVKTRSYNSPTRRMQLTATKAAVLAAARDLIVRQGYPATTMDQIAAEAGVAVQTVYKHFGSKPAIVAAMVEQARLDPRLMEQRRRLLDERDPREQVKLIAQRARLHLETGMHLGWWPLAMPVRVHDPELAGGLQRLGADVRRSQMEYAFSLQRNGGLRVALSVEQAADYIGLLTAPEMLMSMRRDRGWSPERIEQFLVEALSRLLLD